ncbi:aminodeoxychorismate synthase, component I [Jannaschia pagri]|uniref:Aminodeoxychorismate synthase, component I n=1 Tax=Jannaschia pagri TaxID=2829797 RepID=A0ABQ4NRM8_9RHOB|nr:MULTISPECIES: aminodeoxychorismate synthase component I [unclassified Jannaschia]GIT93210.1 aminodeoxychorismate synthase, component I [Jannaschia sp. AI_61]GIT97023.1 aminodeoxychorismate synthase, component I [Jannaschia sp. AI_62]
MTARDPSGVIAFDTGPLGAGTQFSDPVDLIEAWQPEEVAQAFDRLERATARGQWLAGTLSYELGYALVPVLADRMPARRDAPLLRFGVYDAPHALPDRSSQGTGRLGSFTPDWTLERYRDAFDAVHGFLGQGDIYQANLTFPMFADWSGCPFDLYDRLRARQPVPHGAFVDLGGQIALSRSPELFFSVSTSGTMRTRPMKGTRPRSRDARQDKRLRDQLIAAEKDRAENLMITDLLRNDLSRISITGSVRVPMLFEVESYATVHQMVSEVVSDRRANVGLQDTLTALFPCGSITGAPKIRAMQILSELEDAPRGLYCGAIGWIAPDGSMAFNVAIRTILLDPNGRARLNVGGGIVYDSTALSEFQEARLKATFADLGD